MKYSKADIALAKKEFPKIAQEIRELHVQIDAIIEHLQKHQSVSN